MGRFEVVGRESAPLVLQLCSMSSVSNQLGYNGESLEAARESTRSAKTFETPPAQNEKTTYCEATKIFTTDVIDIADMPQVKRVEYDS